MFSLECVCFRVLSCYCVQEIDFNLGGLANALDLPGLRFGINISIYFYFSSHYLYHVNVLNNAISKTLLIVQFYVAPLS